MRHPLVVLALVCAVLWGARLVVPRDLTARSHAPRLVRLDEALPAGRPTVAGLSLTRQGTDPVLYVRARGVWRCLSAWGAPCDAERVEGLVVGLLGARGVVRSDGEADSDERFALTGPDSFELALHGKDLLADPQADEILRVRFGASSRVAGAGRWETSGAFARVAPRPEVLELAFDPRGVLGEPSEGGLPPLLDARLFPGDFAPPGQRIERMFLDRADGSEIELVRRAREARAPGEGVTAAETLDWEWLLVAGERSEPVPPLRGEAYVTWAPRAPYIGLADPKDEQLDERLGLARPQARLTLVRDDGEVVELVIGAPQAEGIVWVRVPSVPLVAAVEAATARLLLPDADELADDARRNRWDEELRAALALTHR